MFVRVIIRLVRSFIWPYNVVYVVIFWQTTGSDLPRLVAVSKKKSVEHIVAAYEYGQRHFGENYVSLL